MLYMYMTVAWQRRAVLICSQEQVKEFEVPKFDFLSMKSWVMEGNRIERHVVAWE